MTDLLEIKNEHERTYYKTIDGNKNSMELDENNEKRNKECNLQISKLNNVEYYNHKFNKKKIF